MKPDKLVINMGAIGDIIADHEILVIKLGSLTDEFQPIIRIIENMADIELLHAKKLSQREWENMTKIDNDELALKASKTKLNYQGNCSKNDRNIFKGRCFIYNKHGHRQKECRQKSARIRDVRIEEKMHMHI